MHDLLLIHTDLKPENILLVSSEYVKLPGCKSSAIKLIDFGTTAFDNQNQSSIVSARHYRAPEIILGLGWSYPSDLWSVGCILIELCTGGALFQTHENLEHLAMMERPRFRKIFRSGSRLNWPEGAVSRESIRAVKKLDRLKIIFPFMHLLEGLLKYDPSERLTARQALNHPFFSESKSMLRNCMSLAELKKIDGRCFEEETEEHKEILDCVESREEPSVEETEKLQKAAIYLHAIRGTDRPQTIENDGMKYDIGSRLVTRIRNNSTGLPKTSY
ncbi:hypothetical protein Golob_005805 [Gossypium lobatum]|uniref:Protein kinase domain-containing protein n=1 Tax=Gossypium lobatum TaxID=34289 RepID=A0A7J8MUN8_9ROSI|nr:hypothetical protein [Gossypium lobatum]